MTTTNKGTKIDVEYMYIYLSASVVSNKMVPKYFHMRVCSIKDLPHSNGICFSALDKFHLVPEGAAALPGKGDTGGLKKGLWEGCVEMWTDQIIGADRSLVTVGRSLTVANGFPPL